MTKKIKQNALSGRFKQTIDAIRNRKFLFVIGLFLLVFAGYLACSFFSFFASGGAFQSEIEALEAGKVVSAEDVDVATGINGAIIADYLINRCFGWSVILVLPFLVLLSLRLMELYRANLTRWFICTVFVIVWGSLFFSFVFGSLFDGSFVSPGGMHGENVTKWISTGIGTVGLALLLLFTAILFMIYLTSKTIDILKKIFSLGFVKKSERSDGSDEQDVLDEQEQTSDETREEVPEEQLELEDDDVEIMNDGQDDVAVDEDVEDDKDNGTAGAGSEKSETETSDEEVVMEVSQASGDNDTGGTMLRPLNPRDELSYYKPPTIDLLRKYDTATQSIDMNEQNANKKRIVEVLKNFDIEISSIKATVGPTITLYEITPAPGIRISKIRHLEDDIAMSLSALCIRIIAPIPGKGTVGIEVPNTDKQIVPMASLLNSRKFKETNMELPLALGKTISNEVFMVDMAKMPHLLVAGATGMGKSVGLNAIITSLLYKMHPAYLKFVMVDPKMVELSLYNVLEKHFLAKLEGDDDPIITDVRKVVRTLKSLCTEMDARYRLLQAARVKSLDEYNKKFINKELLPTKGHRFMPYIVVVIDEYGDLMMTAGKEIEQPIARIAQKARAVGIHMIIATQRPTTNIVTGIIKANFPARMAFRVISAIDSKTILDRSGANQLQGRGDMLFLAGNDPVRVQCALIETDEVERVCEYIAKQQSYSTAYILPEPDETSGDGDYSGNGGGGSMSDGELTSDKLDPLFVEAARTVVIHQQGSTSMLQRKYNVGFNRAGRIMDQLCRMGIVGEQDGAKPRQVLCADEADLEFRLKSIFNM